MSKFIFSPGGTFIQRWIWCFIIYIEKGVINSKFWKGYVFQPFKLWYVFNTHSRDQNRTGILITARCITFLFRCCSQITTGVISSYAVHVLTKRAWVEVFQFSRRNFKNFWNLTKVLREILHTRHMHDEPCSQWSQNGYYIPLSGWQWWLGVERYWPLYRSINIFQEHNLKDG